MKIFAATAAMALLMGLNAALLPVLLRPAWSAARVDNAKMNVACVIVAVFCLVLPYVAEEPPSRALKLGSYAFALFFACLLVWGLMR